MGTYSISTGTGGLLYNGSLSSSTVYAFPTATSNGSNYPGADSNNPYGPTFGSATGILEVVGAYKTAGSSYSNGYLYNAAAPSGSQYTVINDPNNSLNNIPHSIFGNQVVGNYNVGPNGDNQDIAGNAFVYDIAAQTYTTLDAPNAHGRTSAYGIYGNVIAGGYQDQTNRITHGFLYNQNTGVYTDYDAPNTSGSGTAGLTHFQGITSAGQAGVYNLVALSTDSSGMHYWYVTINTNPGGAAPTWTLLTNGTSSITANSIYQGTLIGTSNSFVQSWQVTIPNSYFPTTNTATLTSDTANSVVISGAGNDVLNSGSITVTGTGSQGINSTDYGVVTNTGGLTASGSNSAAIEMAGQYGTLLNEGTLTATSGAYAIKTDSSSVGTMVVNTGTIDGVVDVISGPYGRFENSGWMGIGSSNTSDPGMVSNISGTFVQTSLGTLGLRVSSTAADKLDIAGTAKVTGAVQANVALGSSINGASRYSILNATNGLSGTFSSVQTNLSLVNGTISYDSNNAYLGFQANYSSAASTQNQAAVASGLQSSFYSSPSTSGQAILNALNFASITQAQSTFNSLSGEGISAQQTANFDATNITVDTIRRQGTYWVMDECQTGAGSKKNSAQFNMTIGSSCATDDNRQFRSWVVGVGGSNSLTGSSIVGSSSVSTQTGGGLVGFDYEVSPNFLVGAMAGATSTSYNVSSLSSSGSVTSGQFGVYSVAKWNKFYVNSIFDYGYFSNASTRFVSGVGPTTKESSSNNSNAFTGRMEVGYRVEHPVVNMMPFIAMQVTSLQMGNYNESNTNNLGLSVQSKNVMSEPGSLGIQIDKAYDIDKEWSLYPLLRMAWVHEFQTDRTLTGSLQALPTGTWTVNGASAAANAADIGISLQAMNKDGFAFFASGNAIASSTSQGYMGQMGLKILF